MKIVTSITIRLGGKKENISLGATSSDTGPKASVNSGKISTIVNFYAEG